MRLAACVLAISLGCGGVHARRTMHRAELVMAVALAGVLASSITLAVAPDARPVLVPIIATFGAAAVGGLGVYLYANATAVDAPAPAEQARADDRAWQLTRRAAEAARNGDCKTALGFAPQVRSLDEDFYKKVFARDAAISRCAAKGR